MRDRTAQTDPLTTGQQIVAKWEGLNGWTEPADLAEGIDDAIAAARSAALEEAAKVAQDDTSFMMLQDFGMQSTCTQVRENIAAAIRELKDK